MSLKQHAVLLTVLFALTVSLVSVTLIFYEFFKLNRNQYIDSIFTKYSVITQIYKEHQQRKSSEIMLEANLAVYNFRMEKNKEIKRLILQKGNVLKQEGFQSVDDAIMLNSRGVFTQKIVSDLRATMLQYKSVIYFHIETPTGSIMIEDEELKPYRPWNILYVYTTVIAVIAFSFFMILQKLRPLIRLRRKIALFGNGNLNISFKTSGTDEIALVANELENARKKINTILESRTLFLRNIMHELKTPIAKGTIATQMLESPKQRDRFCSIFGRLESLVNEFALIEEVTSLGDRTEFSEYRLIDVIDGAIDMAMADMSAVSIDVVPTTKVHVNYKLYTTAIKNMIDNGIKYSTDGHVHIAFRNNELYFESKGECIKHPLQYYIEPFTKDNPSKNSFGLGLYLVDSILKVHDQVLAHEYEGEMNRFIFV